MAGRRPALLMGMVLVACVACVVGCGGSAKHGAAEAEPSAAISGTGAGNEATAAKERVVRLKQAEAAEEAALKRRVEIAKRAEAKAAAEAAHGGSTTTKHSPHATKDHAASKHQRQARPAKPAKPARPKKAKPGESAAEKAARERFAKEEAQEQATFKKQERAEAGR